MSPQVKQCAEPVEPKESKVGPSQWWKFMRSPWFALGLLSLLLVFPLLAPLWDLGFYVSVVRRIFIVGLAASSLNLLLGYGGLVALGHSAFVGLGAYVVAVCGAEGLFNAALTWPLAILICALTATLIGAISVRTRGVYFIMITLAFAQMIYYVCISLRQYGGDDGITMLRPSELPGLNLANDTSFYYFALAIVVVFLFLSDRLVQSRFGRALQGVRENSERMQALGYPVFAIKLFTFVLASTIAGLAGILLANQNLFVSPMMMHWTESASLIIMVLVGGVGARFGGMVGAAVILLFEEFLRLYTDYWHIPLGLLLLLVVLWAPRGLTGMWRRT
jgi:branched-chain amino acid transport system permease protein